MQRGEYPYRAMAKLVVFLQETTGYLGYLADHVSRDIDLAINPLPTPSTLPPSNCIN